MDSSFRCDMDSGATVLADGKMCSLLLQINNPSGGKVSFSPAFVSSSVLEASDDDEEEGDKFSTTQSVKADLFFCSFIDDNGKIW